MTRAVLVLLTIPILAVLAVAMVVLEWMMHTAARLARALYRATANAEPPSMADYREDDDLDARIVLQLRADATVAEMEGDSGDLHRAAADAIERLTSRLRFARWSRRTDGLPDGS